MNIERLNGRKARLEQALAEGHESAERVAEWTAELATINKQLGVQPEEKPGNNRIEVPVATMGLKP